MQAFNYTASIKLSTTNGVVFSDIYPSVVNLSIASREFLDYNDCVTSCRLFMDDMKSRINKTSDGPIFKISSEINPVFSQTSTISKDWAAHEVARLWIFDEVMEKTGQIHAVGQARVFETNRPTGVSLSS